MSALRPSVLRHATFGRDGVAFEAMRTGPLHQAAAPVAGVGDDVAPVLVVLVRDPRAATVWFAPPPAGPNATGARRCRPRRRAARAPADGT
jgi:hypothetical protein